MMTTDEFALISFSLKLSEHELQIIADEQDSNVEDLTKLVKENEGLLDKMKVRRTFDRFSRCCTVFRAQNLHNNAITFSTIFAKLSSRKRQK